MVNSNERLLLFAAKRGAVEVCRQLLLEAKKGVRIDVRDGALKTPLLLAAEEGHLEVMTLLLEHGANVQAQDPVGMTPLHLAAWTGQKVMAKTLLLHQAHVNARNRIGQTPLHGAALCAHYDIVCLLLDAGANPNAQSLARQRLPLHELALRQDKPKERLKIHQLLLQCSPDTLYSIFFCKHNSRDLPDWYGRMISFIYDVNDCRIFYTILRTSLVLQLISTKQAQEFAERAFDQCAEHCVTKEDWRILWLLLNKACMEDDDDKLVRPHFYQMMQDYHKRQPLQKRVVSLDLQASVRRGIRLLSAGVDGNITTLKNCYMFFLQAMKDIMILENENENVTDNDNKSSKSDKGSSSVSSNTGSNNNNTTSNNNANIQVTQKRVDALVGVIGTLLNAILLGRHTHDHCFRKLLSRSVDLLDPLHLEQCMIRDFPGIQRESLQTALTVGLKAGRKVSEQGDQQWHFDDAISREDGLVIVGLCAGTLGRSLKEESPLTQDEDAASVDSNGSGTSRMSTFTTFTTLTIANNVFREDSFLSPDEEAILKLHKAVKYCNDRLLKEALEVAVQEDTVNVVDSAGRTALDLAALTGQIRFFEKIRAVGGKPKYFKSEAGIRRIVQARSKHAGTYQQTVAAKLKDKGTIETQSMSASAGMK